MGSAIFGGILFPAVRRESNKLKKTGNRDASFFLQMTMLNSYPYPTTSRDRQERHPGRNHSLKAPFQRPHSIIFFRVVPGEWLHQISAGQENECLLKKAHVAFSCLLTGRKLFFILRKRVRVGATRGTSPFVWFHAHGEL